MDHTDTSGGAEGTLDKAHPLLLSLKGRFRSHRRLDPRHVSSNCVVITVSVLYKIYKETAKLI